MSALSTEMPSSKPTSGWYPDPLLHGHVRFWTGSGWSRHIQRSQDRRARGGAEGSPRPGWYPDPSGRSAVRYWDGWGWTTHVEARAGRSRGWRSLVASRPTWAGLSAKLVRYGAVSVIATVTTLVVLGLLVGALNAPAGWANAVAVAIGTVPSFELNRRWVWTKTGQRSLAREVLPFLSFCAFELIVSTAVVHAVARAIHGSSLDHLVQTLIIECANIATFGSLWIIQYLILDRVLFARGNTAVTPR